MRIDGHIHTRYSPDSLLRLERLVQLAARRRIDAVAITDHNTIDGALELQRITPQLQIIIGEEITTRKGELIGLFLQERVPPGLDPLATIARIHEQGGLVVLPHPCDRLRRKVLQRDCWEEVLPLVDLVEGFNGRTVFAADDRAACELAAHFHKPLYAGSDAHTSWEFGRCGLELPEFDSAQSFLRSIKKAKFFGRHAPPWPHVVTKIVKKTRRQETGDRSQ
jgi:predicted metal-dependent phosphoesterase TrpH